MNKKLSLIAITALLATNNIAPISVSWFTENFSRAFSSIKNYPATCATIGLAATAACLYQSGQYKEKINKATVFITNLSDAEKSLVNNAIATPLAYHELIEIAERFYERIENRNMSRLSKATLSYMVEQYNETLREQQGIAQTEPGYVHAEFEEARRDLRKYIDLLNDRQAAINHVEKLELYRDRWDIVSYLCGAASLVPLAILAKKYC